MGLIVWLKDKFFGHSEVLEEERHRLEHLRHDLERHQHRGPDLLERLHMENGIFDDIELPQRTTSSDAYSQEEMENEEDDARDEAANR